MINPLTWLSRRRFPYEPLITVEISKSRLINNLNEFRKIAPRHSVAPVLKSNAYGHGLLEVARILEENKAANAAASIPFFAVDSYFEAVALRSHGIRTPLLIIGYTRPETIIDSRLQKVNYAVTSLEALRDLAEYNGAAHIELKIDTGMRRQGVLPEEIPECISLLHDNPELVLKGIFSHLCDSDNKDESFTESQINVWRKSVAQLTSEFPAIDHIHLSATDSHRFSDDITANSTRLGLGLYGIAPFTPTVKPVFEMKTIITATKTLRAGETAGYGNTFKAAHDMQIATIPVGYYEGLDRRLSNRGQVEVGKNRVRCPIIGRVSMNITIIDASRVSDAEIGTPVTVISNNPRSPASIQEMAKICQTIPYELLVHIPNNLKREIVE